ncbi:uncharacterized protein BJ171DRAFT_446542 [Polychytrium aggregatum]|uniref:uncharacterized protein n=1 Tax=Polychytrium aggregatum TaxID=110093 RepID=UPI0022FDC559|nr:uncharacterized protein BJ171DRAFT_446542 [Polychytrium aggregatum]KAI9197103.1 hypothetical protein BJ171DRAFT_446542 [Polychytrium aggregatum]
MASIHEQLETKGYVIIDNLIPEDLFNSLVEAADRVIAKGRNSEWRERRTVGKQFPPWPKDEAIYDIWAIQHVMHPDLGEPVFAQYYASEPMLKTITELLEVPRDQLQLELFNLLINPVDNEFALTWHRDCIEVNVSEEVEQERLKIPHYGTQWNTALYDDSCFIFVPGSHNRLRTPEERRVNIEEPYGHMPGEVVLHLKPGQTVFYNNNLLHRAHYPKGVKRASLHGSMGITSGGPTRAQNILQHGLDWIKSDRFRATLPPAALPLHDNLLRLAEARKDVKLEYDHPNDGFAVKNEA